MRWFEIIDPETGCDRHGIDPQGTGPVSIDQITRRSGRRPPTIYGRPVVAGKPGEKPENMERERLRLIAIQYGPDRNAENRQARKEEAEIAAKIARAALDCAKAAELRRI